MSDDPDRNKGGLHTLEVEVAATLTGDLAIALDLASLALIAIGPVSGIT